MQPVLVLVLTDSIWKLLHRERLMQLYMLMVDCIGSIPVAVSQHGEPTSAQGDHAGEANGALSTAWAKCQVNADAA